MIAAILAPALRIAVFAGMEVAKVAHFNFIGISFAVFAFDLGHPQIMNRKQYIKFFYSSFMLISQVILLPIRLKLQLLSR